MWWHLVVAGGVEDVVQGAQAGHQLGVDPELVEGAQLLVDHGVAHWDQQRQGEVKWLQNEANLYRLWIFFLPRIQMIEKQTVLDLWQG